MQDTRAGRCGRVKAACFVAVNGSEVAHSSRLVASAFCQFALFHRFLCEQAPFTPSSPPERIERNPWQLLRPPGP